MVLEASAISAIDSRPPADRLINMNLEPHHRQRAQLNNPLAPLSIPVYRNFWIAGMFSNIGTWMHETGAVWLMTDLSPQPEWVAAVRVAMTVPIFCLALPAGVWADHFDRRLWLIRTQSLLLTIALLMAALTMLGWMSPPLLLVLTACMGVALILNLPAWQALTPELVPHELIPSAIQAGSVSFNLARSIGPACAGLIIAQLGVGATFLFNGLSFLGIILALVCWQPAEAATAHRQVRPRFYDELRKGIFILRSSVHLRSTLIRILAFTFSASALWSLLSLVATEKLGFRERGFGFCLAALGVGAVLAAGLLPWVRQRISSEAIVLVAQLVMAGQMGVIALTQSAGWVMAALVITGGCWMFKLTTLNATAQVRLPRRFRARGMSAFVMFFALGMGLGSLTWGWLARGLELGPTFALAALTLAVLALATHRLPLGTLQVEPLVE